MAEIIDGMFPRHDKLMIFGPESDYKSWVEAATFVYIASGTSLLGLPVMQGPIVGINTENSPLGGRLDRFAWHLGYKGYRDLPITILENSPFKLGRKTELDKVIEIVKSIKPILIGLDSFVSALPSGRQGLEENNDHTGIILRDDLNSLKEVCDSAILIITHTKKSMVFELDDFVNMNPRDMVRGHGTIVGQGSDTCLGVKALSRFPQDSTFALIPRERRTAIRLQGTPIYVKLYEPMGHGRGPVSLVSIPKPVPSPSELTIRLAKYFKIQSLCNERGIKKDFALCRPKELRMSIMELIEQKIIAYASGPTDYELSKQYNQVADPTYVKILGI